MRTLFALSALLLASQAHAASVSVTNPDELRAAVENASPGDVITLAPGTYDISGNITCDTVADAANPIVVRAETLGEAFIRFNAVEGFRVVAPHWTFENLDIEGVCATDDECEHAFHITGEADATIIRDSRLHEYNAMIKGNGEPLGANGAFVYPDDVLIERCEFFSAAPRQTANPVTPIDVVGGRRWIIRQNFIHDHAKDGGNFISFAAFLKGNSRDGLFEGNLIACELLHAGQVRLGLSFGGGGTSPDSICEDGTCSPEHQNGIMRNNIIVNCPTDVGIFLNKGQNVSLYNNTLYNTTGIDVRFVESVADVRNNILNGAIRNRDGGTSTQSANLVVSSTAELDALFVNPSASDFTLVNGASLVGLAEVVPEVTDDFCRNTRDDGAPDIGAVEYDGDVACDTTRPFQGAAPTPEPEPEPNDPKTGEGCQVSPTSQGSSVFLLALVALLLVRRRVL